MPRGEFPSLRGATHALGKIRSPFLPHPVLLSASGPGASSLLFSEEETRWHVAFKAGSQGLSVLHIPVGHPREILLENLSFPLSYLRGNALSLAARSVTFAESASSPALCLAASCATPMAIQLHEGVWHAGCVLKEGTALAISRRETAAEGLPGIPLGRDTPDPVAARAFLALFAFLDTADAALFGAPTQAHRKIFRHLVLVKTQIRDTVEAFGVQSFRLLEETEGAVPLGYELLSGPSCIVFARGTPPPVAFHPQIQKMHLVGSGAIRIRFAAAAEDRPKGFAVLLYDRYGRPRLLQGGRCPLQRSFHLAEGERLEIERT